MPDLQTLTTNLLAACREVAAASARERLVLLVGPPRSGKTTTLRASASALGWPLLNLNVALAQRLLAVPLNDRPVRVHDLAHAVAAEHPGDGLAIDNIEILFQRDLQVDAEALLRSLSRLRPVVASWPGAVDGGALTYGVAPHPEHERWARPEARLVAISETHA